MEPEMRFVHVQQVPCASGGLYHSSVKSRELLARTRARLRTFNIRGLPLELRAIIFREDLLEWVNGELTPALIKALRPESPLYQEALNLFYSLKNMFNIGEKRTQRLVDATVCSEESAFCESLLWVSSYNISYAPFGYFLTGVEMNFEEEPGHSG
jgi:hypothetical protein